jgi:hypothetical protein
MSKIPLISAIYCAVMCGVHIASDSWAYALVLLILAHINITIYVRILNMEEEEE